MSSSRRARARKESSFLEGVKASLDILIAEVSHVKLLLQTQAPEIDLTMPPPAPPPLPSDFLSRDTLLSFSGVCKPGTAIFSTRCLESSGKRYLNLCELVDVDGGIASSEGVVSGMGEPDIYARIYNAQLEAARAKYSLSLDSFSHAPVKIEHCHTFCSSSVDVQTEVASFSAERNTKSDWRDHIEWTKPSSGKPKSRMMDASLPEDVDDDQQLYISSGCRLVGAPSCLDTALVYSDDELAHICDSLIAPLAREMHKLDDLAYVTSTIPFDIVSDGVKHGLGRLIQDVCNKVVPLTAVLAAKRHTAKAVIRARELGMSEEEVQEVIQMAENAWSLKAG